MIRVWLRRRYVAYRRWRLLAAYARVFEIRHQKPVGFSPLVYALQEAERDGVLEHTDDGIKWRWPDDAA